jgi:eukaryotic-like serine/threonine-protein kinase
VILERWQTIKQIVGAALELEPAERPSFLERACPPDESLRAEIESLLAAYQSNALSNPLAFASLGNINEFPRAVGPYRLIRQLGVGGMGQVWLAEQSEPVRRQLAVKLIRTGMYDSSAVHRFQAERQSLALMEHPSIAKVFDAGATPQGQPYFAMEYVDGLPINQYCDDKRLGIRARLQLFLQVCDGVQHAHQKAIIHRDLKPSNILIVEVDGKPTPRIIDFGLAKVVSDSVANDTQVTQVGILLGTPGYMSPEQADPGLQDVDTRADVFSLGVILYELLTGYLPFDTSRWKSQGIEAVLRELRETDPQRPSARIGRNASGQEDASRARVRNTVVRQLAASLAGDLDSITLKALERNRERRYASAAEFAADLRRFLDDRPVMATPASAMYRWGKYLRRHRWAAAMVTIALLLVIVFVTNQSIQLRRIKRERDRADRIAQFTTGIFTVADPGEARGNKITARELLDRAEHNIDVELKADPALQSQMLKVIAIVYQRLGLYSNAIRLFERVIDLNNKHLEPNDPETLSAAAYLAHCQAQAGQLQAADRTDRDLLPVVTEVLGKDHRTTLQVKSDLAWTLESEGHLSEGESLAREALAAQMRTLGEGDRDTLDTMRSLAWALTDDGHYAEAEQLDRKALAISRQALGLEDPKTLLFMESLATTLGEESRDAEAEQILRETLTVQQRVLGPDHQNVATTMNSLGIALQHQKQYADARKFYQGGLDIIIRTLGPENPGALLAKLNIATVEEDTGNLKRAEEQLKEVLDVQLRTQGRFHQHVVLSLFDLGEVYREENRYADAIAEFQQAVEVSRKVFGPANPSTTDALYGLASAYNLDGRPDKAIEMLNQAVDVGYSDNKALVADQDLKSLATDPRFAAIVEHAEHNAAAKH